jgi:putative NADH-flavin reductase
VKLLVFGSTGGTGREIVRQGLEQGHAVTAFARSPARLGLRHERLRDVEGDVLDLQAVERVTPGHDAALCAIGAPASDRRGVREAGTRHIIRAMESAGPRRLICLASLGYGDSREILPFHMKYLVVPLFLRHAFADHERQEACVKASQLDWIIARPAALTNGPHTGTYRHGFPATERGLRLRISRADVADFMLKQLCDDTYLNKTPSLSY